MTLVELKVCYKNSLSINKDLVFQVEEVDLTNASKVEEKVEKGQVVFQTKTQANTTILGEGVQLGGTL